MSACEPLTPEEKIEEALGKRDFQKIYELLDDGEWSINRRFGVAGHSLLHAAVEDAVKTGDLSFLERILKWPGVYADARDRHGRSALHLAASHQNTAVIQSLLKHKAAIRALNQRGYTPLDESYERRKQSGMKGIIRTLCNHNAVAEKYQYQINCQKIVERSLSEECAQLLQQGASGFESDWDAWIFEEASVEESQTRLDSAWKASFKKYRADGSKKSLLNQCRAEAEKKLGIDRQQKETQNPWEEQT